MLCYTLASLLYCGMTCYPHRLVSNLVGNLGCGLSKRLGEVHYTYFPLEPESMTPGAGGGIQAV